MTSTVLDVTVLLLCVSASVVALGAAGGGVGDGGSAAADAADRLATETVTVTYEAPDATADTRTVHATRAELLAMLVEATERETDDGEATAAFTSRAQSAITEGLGSRTRLDVRAVVTPSAEESVPTDATEETVRVELFDGPPSTGSEESSTTGGTAGEGDTVETTDVADTAGVTGAPWKLSNDTGTPSWPTTATGRSWGEELRPALAAGERSEATVTDEHGDTAGSEVTRTEFGLGATPPRNADTTTAVLTHPVSGESGSAEAVRIVVRRW